MVIPARTSATAAAGPNSPGSSLSARRGSLSARRGSLSARRGSLSARGNLSARRWEPAAAWVVRVPIVCALLLGVLLALAPRQARAQEPLRILVLEGPTSDWVRRVRGQLSDLPVSISTLALVVEGQPEPELVRQLGPIAEHRDAALVAWLMTERLDARGAALPGRAASPSSSTRVAVWFARTGRLFSRPIGGSWTRLSASDRSGVLELGALSVRSAVRSLLLDPTQSEPFQLEPARPSAAAAPPASTAASTASPSAVTGTAPRAASPSSAAPSAAPNPTPTRAAPAAAQSAARTGTAPTAALQEAPGSASTDPAALRAVAPSQVEGSAPRDAAQPQDGPIVAPRAAALVTTDRASSEAGAQGLALDLHWNAELGVSGQLPGPPAYAAAAFEAAVRARQHAWGVLVLGQLGLPLRAKVGPSEVQVLQHALLAEGQYLRWSTGPWSFGPVLRAGLRLARRETVAGDPGLDASTVKWLPGLRLGLGWATELRIDQRFGATLRGVLHWDPVQPNFEVQTSQGEPVASAQAWAVQPSLELCGNWYW
jgi:hypothetical protein